MRSDLLKWIASGLIAVVLISTLWMALAIHPEQGSPRLLIARATPTAAAAASAPAITANE